MRCNYSIAHPGQGEAESLPRLPLVLHYGEQQLELVGLVDSGATVNVLPYTVGLQLGAVWDGAKARITLGGNLGSHPAMPLVVSAQVGEYPMVRLVFAWSQSDRVPIILGQANFLMEFDACFYRSQLAFEVKPKSA